ncbi:MAG: hypothetical protein P4L55_13020 [Syntrophobacteraceae bacterium]|nr:hypothetical protein [Syntrophobacteraceae bacterium]
MSKRILFALAFALVLVSGAFLNARAATLSGQYFSQPACWSFACGLNSAHAISQTPALVTPVQMGAVGF